MVRTPGALITFSLTIRTQGVQRGEGERLGLASWQLSELVSDAHVTLQKLRRKSKLPPPGDVEQERSAP